MYQHSQDITQISTKDGVPIKRNFIQPYDVTLEMIEAGASVLYDLEGEASKEAQARAVFSAMASLAPCARPPDSSTESKDAD